MRTSKSKLLWVALCAAAVGATACKAGRSEAITGTSDVYKVQGQYELLRIDRVDSLDVVNGRAVVRGAPGDVTLDLPAAADPQKRTQHFALMGEAHVDGRRLVTFTESEKVIDFDLSLPEGDAPLHFGFFAGRQGGDVLVFASGDRAAKSPCIYGYVTIEGGPKQN